MAINEHQRDTRRLYIGSSDAAAIMGVDPYRSKADVWLEKTGRVDSFAGNKNTDRGAFLEPAILSWAESQLGTTLERDISLVHPDGILAANLDARGALAVRFIVEAKSAVNADDWGEEDTDQVPDRHLIQVHEQFAVAGRDYQLAFIPVLIPGYRSFDFRMYRVKCDADLMNAIVDQCTEFHDRYIKTDTRPDDFRPSLEVLKRIRREPSSCVTLCDELVDRYIVARASEKQAKADADEIQTELIASLGEAESGSYSAGKVTYLETRRSAYEVKASTYRQLRIKSNKTPSKMAETVGAA